MAVAAHVVLVPPRNNCERIFPSQSKRFKPLPIRPRPRQPQDLMQKAFACTASPPQQDQPRGSTRIETSCHSGRHFSRASCTASRRRLDASICFVGLRSSGRVFLATTMLGFLWELHPLRCFLPSSCRLMRGTWTEKLAVSCALATPPQASK